MAGWAGFSDEELRRMQQKAPADEVVPSVSGHGRRPAPTNRSRQQMQMERALKTTTRKHVSGSLPPEQRLAKPEEHASNEVPPAPPVPEATEAVKETTQDDRKTLILKTEPEPEPEPDSAPVPKELEKQEVELREKTRLELLQQEQRMMEEMNKRKKALLSKTLAEKSRKTQAETVKLKKIQRELQALDDMVSNDIGILRGWIEQATWNYSSAWSKQAIVAEGHPQKVWFAFQDPVQPGGGRVCEGKAGPAQEGRAEGAADGAPVRHHPAERAAQGPKAGAADEAAGAAA
ncbi:RAB6-interacting golgin-like isoform X2 [Anguilla rostrata]|uniref:RAB6-interacting golgin-like isoform X2 n=1 Tax=Anguilla rostrata TaxID=7938 RepID=UPI0030D3DB8E